MSYQIMPRHIAGQANKVDERLPTASHIYIYIIIIIITTTTNNTNNIIIINNNNSNNGNSGQSMAHRTVDYLVLDVSACVSLLFISDVSIRINCGEHRDKASIKFQ